MRAVDSTHKPIPRRWRGFRLVVLIFFAIAIGPSLCFALLVIPDAVTIFLAQQQALRQVVAHAYPNAQVVRADSVAGDSPAGDNGWVEVLVTFETPDSFDGVNAWYVQHPEGGRSSTEGNSFPKYGLTLVSVDPNGKTRYTVKYRLDTTCHFGCVRPSQQIQ
jgi:hypothetical protein